MYIKNIRCVTGQELARAAKVDINFIRSAVKRGGLRPDPLTGLFPLDNKFNRGWIELRGIKISELKTFVPEHGETYFINSSSDIDFLKCCINMKGCAIC